MQSEPAATSQHDTDPTISLANTDIVGDNPSVEEIPAPSAGQKKWAPPTSVANPFGFENIKTAENRIRLLKSRDAWVIRFDHNPNTDKGPQGESYGKENPHPVLKLLKSEGFRWGFDGGDDKGGWGKPFGEDPYGTDHIDARRVLRQAAEMMGAEREESVQR